ncbi:FtsX-like permease family protein [Roseivirga sp. E12]|uniref:FtsX-like permease family protein n=1 Tax=Roseivirga sp. E12 TaxID=2819237 RepID=UPI001ABBEE08|nr:FtsX-like permease family protein [Roseivirga sp. E12]MBO3700659.1 ABC transporter permease [Roseivirga sp. E12]
MIKNYFITAIRNLVRNKSFTIINVFGLALGISAALVLFKIVLFEKSFDQHYSNYDRLYRFVKKVESPNLIEFEAGIQNPFAQAFKTDYPDLGLPVRTFYIGENQLSVENANGDWTHYEQRDGIAFTDPEFFELFDYEWKIGDPSTALNKPGSAVITVSLAEKLFGVTDGGYDRVVGKEVKLNSKLVTFITGVVEDTKQNSSLPFKIMVEYESVEAIFDFFQKESWTSTSSNAQVYFLINENVKPEQVNQVLPEMVDKYIPKTENASSFKLQAMSDIHFDRTYNTYGDLAISSEANVFRIAIALFLILTACINFVNLSTALAIKRSKEVGIRKVLGGHKGQLMFQFLGETFLITLLSVVLSMGIAELIMTNLNDLIGYELSLDLANDMVLLGLVLSVILGVTLLAGLYPSLILSKLKPVSVLRGKGQSALSGNINTRRGLVIFQFFISQVLVICTLVVISQMKYFESRDLGFRQSSIITFPLPSNEGEKLNTMRNEIFKFPGVEEVSYAFASPLSESNIGSNFAYEPLQMDATFDVAFKVIDDNYIDLYGIELLAGRDISKLDTLTEALVSTEILKLMEIENPEDAIGLDVQTGFSGDKKIVGVFKAFHNKDLKEKIDPMIMVRFHGYFYEGAVRFEGSDQQFSELMASVERAWSAQYPDILFDYNVLSDEILTNYEEEANMLTLFQVFSGIAILIGCLGLYGLVSFMANQKMKEIGIRKVLGATIPQILKLFSKELLILIAIAFLVATPVSYYFMKDWLADFEYSINMNAWVFVIAIGFTMLIGMVTTGVKSFSAATSNPVDSLRSE